MPRVAAPALIGACALSLVACSGEAQEPRAPAVVHDSGVHDSVSETWGLPDLNAIQCDSSLLSLRDSVFKVACGFEHCHGNAPAFGLHLDMADLAALEERLVNVTARGCRSERLVVPGHPEQSFLYRKLADEDPPCSGDRMPSALGVLPDRVVECVAGWIRALASDGGHDAGSDR
jgi:hypothetical protein